MSGGLAGWGLFLAVACTPFGTLLERTMTSHMLIQYPLLGLAGTLIALSCTKTCENLCAYLNRGGIPGVLVAGFTLVFWMIPRWVDLSLSDDFVALLKYLSITFLVGFPLAMSWKRLHPHRRRSGQNRIPDHAASTRMDLLCFAGQVMQQLFDRRSNAAGKRVADGRRVVVNLLDHAFNL